MVVACLGLLTLGCGTTKSQLAKEQMLMSDAVDQAVGQIDFRTLSGEKVYFDSKYIQNIKGVGFVNSEYIISSLRQQMMAADCRLQDEPTEADFVVEARVGTLGTNGHEIVYGVPASNSLSTAASLVPNAPNIPTIPEISFARKDAQLGAAKIAVFAYERQSKRPVWQSGTSRASSKALDVWLLGAGPFQSGSVYEGPQFAGTRFRLQDSDHEARPLAGSYVDYDEEFHFPRALAPVDREVDVAGFQEELPPVVNPPPTAATSEPAPLPSASSQEANP